MLSRLALRAGTQALRSQQPFLPASLSVLPARDFNTHTRTLDERLKIFKEVTETYYNNPSRDNKNFPLDSMPEYNPPTRMLIFPDSWFAQLYEKTGVSGPYLLGLGGLLFLLSKEIVLIDHNIAEAYAFATALYFLWYKLHAKLNVMMDADCKEEDDIYWYGPLNIAKQQYTDAVDVLEKAIWQEGGQKYLFEAKKEGVDLQLEAIYRQRLAEAQTSIKKRLDYQLEKENTVKRFQHSYMTRWIVDNVIKGITPEQEKATIAQCLVDLKAIAARQ